jgi:alanine racemase
MPLRALARVNLAAIQRNVARLERELHGTSALCAVVKADGYGHGAVPSAQAAITGGASWLAVATAAEAAQLRAGGIETPILVMGALSREELRVALAARADVVAWSEPFVGELTVAARDGAGMSGGPEERVRVHIKLDTGMGRLGTRELDEALGVATRVLEATAALELTGAMTHFATADENDAFVREQLERFGPFAAEMRTLKPGIIVHAANSAATLCVAASHLDMVRCGIAIYGCDPLHEDPLLRGLEPALELTSYLAAVKRAAPGDSAGYGRRFVAERETWIGTLPIGYGDGIRRDLTNNCDVLVGGVRYPLVGTVSMDNITIDLGPTPDVRTGEIATIIGRSDDERQTVEELADRLETINYEVLCGISARVPRVYHHDGEPL